MSLIHCNLRVLMAERGLNIQKVKDQTTLSRTTISNLYNNLGSGIQYGTLLELCELLKCQPGDLLSYIEVIPNFEVVTKKPDFSIEKDTHITDGDDNDGWIYASVIETDLEVNCFLRYEGFNYDFLFQVKVKFGIDEEKNLESIDIGITSDFNDTLSNLKMPPHVKSDVSDKLDNFLMNWGHDYFYGEEIKGVSKVVSINIYTLLRKKGE